MTREVADHDGVETPAMEGENRERDDRRVAKEISRRRDRKTVLAEKECPDGFRDSRGQQDQEEPAAQLGGQQRLRGTESRREPADDPWRPQRAQRGNPAQTKEKKRDRVTESPPKILRSVPR